MQHLENPIALYAPRRIRPYQQDLANRLVRQVLENENDPCGVLATGGGKSLGIVETFRQLLLAKKPDGTRRFKRGIAMTRSGEILDQLYKDLRMLQLPIGWIRADFETNFMAPIQIASCDTVVARRNAPKHAIEMSMVLSADTFIVCDECHTSTSGIIWDIVSSGKAKVVGFTATPWLTGQRTLREKFDVLEAGPLPAELIRDGFLVEERYLTPETYSSEGLQVQNGDFVGTSISKLMRQPGISQFVVETVFDIVPEGKLIFFVSDKLHAQEVADAIRECGRECVTILESTEKRSDAIEELKNSTSGNLHGVSINILGTGIDIPDLAGVVMLRHTMSSVIFFQQLGRALRTCPGKEFAWIIDFVGNLLRHCQASEIEEYAFDGPKFKSTREAPKKLCPDCGESSGTFAMRCWSCDFLFEETCDNCNEDIRISQTVCRKCGWDRRDEQERIQQLEMAEAKLRALREAFQKNYLIDSEDSFRYDWHSKCWAAWNDEIPPVEPLRWLQSQLRPGVGIEAVINSTCYTLWTQEDIAQQGRDIVFRTYADWLMQHKTGNRFSLSSEEVHHLFSLQFGFEGRQWLTEHIKLQRESIKKENRKWFQKK